MHKLAFAMFLLTSVVSKNTWALSSQEELEGRLLGLQVSFHSTYLTGMHAAYVCLCGSDGSDPSNEVMELASNNWIPLKKQSECVANPIIEMSVRDVVINGDSATATGWLRVDNIPVSYIKYRATKVGDKWERFFAEGYGTTHDDDGVDDAEHEA